jgi:hypothetical protein
MSNESPKAIQIVPASCHACRRTAAKENITINPIRREGGRVGPGCMIFLPRNKIEKFVTEALALRLLNPRPLSNSPRNVAKTKTTRLQISLPKEALLRMLLPLFFVFDLVQEKNAGLAYILMNQIRVKSSTLQQIYARNKVPS